ncbi:uncharacterized protein DEA37_0007549 [Paragonimus westermani]|uniref:Galectin domain-containing protein n=1 Tax=Paragonimus westermani TaxID=34504 RepID=A0A5J4NRR7_9TREM|nr:uncharacterized protein DEA37_0007549 [Paragonimus westermani]
MRQFHSRSNGFGGYDTPSSYGRNPVRIPASYPMEDNSGTLHFGAWEPMGPIIQPIPDNLMVGDYIEINGFCRGPEVIVELLTSDHPSEIDSGLLPLHICLLAGGPVLVKSQSRNKIERQEHNVRMGVQQNMAFELCIYAMDDGYEIKLNKETVCTHKHAVKLEDVAAISMDGDADFTSIEFKDIYGEEDEAQYTNESAQPGFMRVQELRESFSRKRGSPMLVRSSTRRSSRSSKVQSPSSVVKTHWPTSSDLSRPDFDVDVKPAAQAITPMEYVEPEPNVRADYALPTSTQPPYMDTTSQRSKNRLSLKPGSRKSIQLDESKLEGYSLVGGNQSSQVAGNAHGGVYQILDDEQPGIYRTGANTMYVGSTQSIHGSTPSLQDKGKKKRTSLFSRSKGSESDLSTAGTEKKSKGIKNIFKRKKSEHMRFDSLILSFKSIKTLLLPDCLLETCISGLQQRTSTLRSPNKSLLKEGTFKEVNMCQMSLLKQMGIFSIKQLGTIECLSPVYQRSWEADVTVNMRTPTTSGTEIRPSISMPDVYRSEPTGHQGYSTASISERPLYLGAAMDIAPVRGPVPKSVLKDPAPEIAAYMAGQKAVPEFENFTLTPEPSLTQSRMSVTETSRVEPTQTRPTSVISEEPHRRKLKGTAPELADILIDSGRAGFEPNNTLTGGVQEPKVSTPIRESYQPKYEQMEPVKPMKGSAPEIADSITTRFRPENAADVTLTNESALEIPRVSQPAHYTAVSTQPATTEIEIVTTKPGKLKGTAPELAAQFVDTNKTHVFYPLETTLSGMQSQRPKATIIERPNMDVDYRPPVQIEPEYAGKYQYSARSLSVDHNRHNEVDSDASSVHSDAEYYLEVGKSQYYMERRRSLKNYRSRRSRRKEQEARRSLGLGSESNSAHSSISSVKAGDPTIVARKDKVKSGADREQVNSWLNGYTPAFTLKVIANLLLVGYSNEIDVSRTKRPEVHAAAPAFQMPDLQNAVLVEACKLRDQEFGTKFPLPLTAGRKARLAGHFVSPSHDAVECCFIHLDTNCTVFEDDYNDIVLETWSNGDLRIYGIRNNAQTPIGQWINSDQSVTAPYDTEKFSFDLHNRGAYAAITFSDHVTLRLPPSFEMDKLRHVQLEQTCTNAEFDYFSVSNDLMLPLDLIYPNQSHRESIQNLTLSTKLSSDSKQITMEFFTQANKSFKILVDFEQDCIYLNTSENTITTDSLVVKKEIPFVPEQVRELRVVRNTNENELTLYANHTELFNQTLPITRPVGKLNHVHINGDLILLNAKFN